MSKIKQLFAVGVLALGLASCGSDDPTPAPDPVAEQLSGKYLGRSTTTGTFLPAPVQSNDTVMITPLGDATVKLVFESRSWGTSTFEQAQVEKQADGTYTIKGDGTSLMRRPGTTTAVTLPSTLEGTLRADKQGYTFTISVPALGLTIRFENASGDPVETPLALQVAGGYRGHSSVAFSASPTALTSEGDSLQIIPSGMEAVTVVYKGTVWGTATFAKTLVMLEEDGSYTFSGEGTNLLGSPHKPDEAPKEYPATLKGTMSRDKRTCTFTLTLSTLMGGTVITFTPQAPQ